MKAIIYARSAALNQKAVDSQRRQLERYAEENNYEVAAAIALDGISGIANENMMEHLLVQPGRGCRRISRRICKRADQ